MNPRRVILASWQCVVLHTPAGPVRLRLTSDDPNDYADLDLEAPPGMRLEVRPLPMDERPERITRKVARPSDKAARVAPGEVRRAAPSLIQTKSGT